MAGILRDREKTGHLDLEATEFSIRHAMHSLGGVLLEKLLKSMGVFMILGTPAGRGMKQNSWGIVRKK